MGSVNVLFLYKSWILSEARTALSMVGLQNFHARPRRLSRNSRFFIRNESNTERRERTRCLPAFFNYVYMSVWMYK